MQYSRHIVSTNQFKYGGIADSASSLSSVSLVPLCVRVVVADRKRALAYAKLNLRLIVIDRREIVDSLQTLTSFHQVTTELRI